MLRLHDEWLWDFWLARSGPEFHVLYLKAPRSLGDPELRHANATVGHAVSTDLRTWTVLQDALLPGPPGAWDDRAVWTGSIIAAQGRWWCFYTGTRLAEDGLIQRVGAAVSDDLTTWAKHPDNPLMELDPRRYEALDLDAWHDQAWRDPWVMRRNGHYETLLTARAASGPADGRGVVARATSPDLVRWEIGEPLRVEPAGQYGHLEVPQVMEIGGRWYLLFCTADTTHSSAWRARTGAEPRTGTFYAVSDSPSGPFRLVDADPLGPDDGTTCYAGRIIDTDDGPRFLAWRMHDSRGSFAGELIDPIPVEALPDGTLRLG